MKIEYTKDNEESYKEKWLDQNVEFMHLAIGKAVRIMVAQIDNLIFERKYANDEINKIREGDFIHECLLLPNANGNWQNKLHERPTLEQFKDWLFKVEVAFNKFLK